MEGLALGEAEGLAEGDSDGSSDMLSNDSCKSRGQKSASSSVDVS